MAKGMGILSVQTKWHCVFAPHTEVMCYCQETTSAVEPMKVAMTVTVSSVFLLRIVHAEQHRSTSDSSAGERCMVELGCMCLALLMKRRKYAVTASSLVRWLNLLLSMILATVYGLESSPFEIKALHHYTVLSQHQCEV